MTVKVVLGDDEIPRQWYNLAADLPEPPLPPLVRPSKPALPTATVLRKR